MTGETGAEPVDPGRLAGQRGALDALVVERLVREFQPLQILLFGSPVRDEAGPDGDVDLLVVLPRMEDKRQALVAMLRAVNGIPLPLDVIPTDLDEIARRGHVVGTVLRAALRKGKIIYERTD
ncbi:MAG TPA: nucleotidyltransferase domain-containing protein [Clostridiales bacterium]|nr:nucleotidyltransferase domain-containing protein [Clostridiales bacterium]